MWWMSGAAVRCCFLMRTLFAPINGALHPAVVNEVLWGLNPAQLAVSSNSGTVFCQYRGTSIQILR